MTEEWNSLPMKDEAELHGRDGHATAYSPVSGGTGVPPVKIWLGDFAMSLRYISAYAALPWAIELMLIAD